MNSINIIGRGKASWHTHGIYQGNKCSSNGGTLEGYALEARDDTPIYDAEGAEHDAFITFVFRAPLIDVSLQPGQARKAMSQATLIVQAESSVLTSFDYVSVDVYLELLRLQVPGVRFGIVRSGKVIWDAEIVP